MLCVEDHSISQIVILPYLQYIKMRQRTLTNTERSHIVRMREKGVKCKDIADVLQMPRSTISTVLTKYRLTGCMHTESAGHAPQKLTARALRDLGCLVRYDRQQTLAMLADRFHVHRNTIRNYIRKLGFRNRIARQKPYLTLAHTAKRLAFAREHRHWSENDWKNVIWTDESCFELGKTSRQIRVWRKPHEAYAAKCLAPTFKSGRSSVMVWGAFTGFDRSPLVLMPEGARTTNDFVRNVYDGTLSAFYFMHDHPHHLILMEDGAPVHRSKLAQQWRIAYGIEKMEWPPNSPDLNPIENLWKLVKDLLRHHNRPRNKQEMMQTIEAVWNEVSMEKLQTLIASMPKRIEAVIATQGESTKW